MKRLVVLDRDGVINHDSGEVVDTDTSEFDLYATKWFNKTNKVGLIIH